MFENQKVRRHDFDVKPQMKQTKLSVVNITGHNQYDGKKRDRKNSQDKKEKSDAFSQISFKFSFRIFYDYKHSIPWDIWTRNSNQYLSCVLLFNRKSE